MYTKRYMKLHIPEILSMCLTFLRNIVVAHIPENWLKWLYMNEKVIGAGTERVLNWTLISYVLKQKMYTMVVKIRTTQCYFINAHTVMETLCKLPCNLDHSHEIILVLKVTGHFADIGHLFRFEAIRSLQLVLIPTPAFACNEAIIPRVVSPNWSLSLSWILPVATMDLLGNNTAETLLLLSNTRGPILQMLRI